jgi:hypothetical protein
MALADRFSCSIFSVHTAISSSIRLISAASWKSCGRFRYSSNNEFRLAFKTSRFFLNTSVVANVSCVIKRFTYPGGRSGRGLISLLECSNNTLQKKDGQTERPRHGACNCTTVAKLKRICYLLKWTNHKKNSLGLRNDSRSPKACRLG